MSEAVLFPDKGSKISLGKVYHPLAFGSTRPRNMMPAHLHSTGDERTVRNISRRLKQQKKLDSFRLEALRRREKVFALEEEHKKRHNKHMSNKRLAQFKKGIDNLHKQEDSLKPPDQTGFLRNYSSLDKSTWSMDEMRDWYTKAAPKVETTAMRAWEFAGATNSSLTDTASGTALHSPVRTAMPRIASASTIGSLGSGRHGVGVTIGAGAMPGVLRSRSAHWSDFEGSLAESKRSNAHKEGLYNLRRPWLDRDEDKVGAPSLEKLQARETALYDMRNAAEARTLRETLKSKMQRGVGHSPPEK